MLKPNLHWDSYKCIEKNIAMNYFTFRRWEKGLQLPVEDKETRAAVPRTGKNMRKYSLWQQI